MAAHDSALVTAIQHFCLHDGPGTRSAVFFKGCPLRCSYCHNPESLRKTQETIFRPHKCLACGSCVESCPHGAKKSPESVVVSTCKACFACEQSCPSGALQVAGKHMTVSEVMAHIEPEIPLLETSGGGVTLSGGEPTAQGRFTSKLAAELKRRGLHVTLETCGHFDLSKAWAEQLLAHLDLILFDIKVFDSSEHKHCCGAGNERIIANLRELVARHKKGAGPRIWPRLPLVPQKTSHRDNLLGWAGLLLELDIRGLTLVTYHSMARAKGVLTQGSPLPPETLEKLSPEAEQQARQTLEQAGVRCFAPGQEP